MKTYKKALYTLKQGDKFIYNGVIHTVYTKEGNMMEIFRHGEFKAWPTWNGMGPTLVDYMVQPAIQEENVNNPQFINYTAI